jgi:protein gp37
MAAGLTKDPVRREAYDIATIDGHWSGRIGVAEESFWKHKFPKNKSVFVGSMSDVALWPEDNAHTGLEFAIRMNWKTMFLLLTKRPGEWLKRFCHLPNCWCGVTVENQEWADKRIPELLKYCTSGRTFVSCEPLLGAINLEKIVIKKVGEKQAQRGKPDISFKALSGWYGGKGNNKTRLGAVIAGGETGPNARPTHPDWVRGLRDQCEAAEVPFFFKQWGEYRECLPPDDHEWCIKPTSTVEMCGAWFTRIGKKRASRLLDGQEHNDLPWNVKGLEEE